MCATSTKRSSNFRIISTNISEKTTPTKNESNIEVKSKLSAATPRTITSQDKDGIF